MTITIPSFELNLGLLRSFMQYMRWLASIVSRYGRAGLRHIRYFAAVAEERHAAWAAEGPGIRHPPLSLQFRQLEHHKGLPLFRRLMRGVDLTEAWRLSLRRTRRLPQDSRLRGLSSGVSSGQPIPSQIDALYRGYRLE